jgi:hypothetical protein
MDKLSEKKEIIALEKKLKNNGQEHFVEELRNMSLGELEFKLKDLAKHNQAIITTKKQDDELLEAKAHVKSLSAPYNEQVAANKLKSRFIGLLIQEIEGL